MPELINTREDLFQFHKSICDRAERLMELKNADYSKGTPLANFFVCEALQTCSAENGILVRMGDKLSRITSILEKGSQVNDESVNDTIVDIINYAVLLAAVVQHKSAVK